MGGEAGAAARWQSDKMREIKQKIYTFQFVYGNQSLRALSIIVQNLSNSIMKLFGLQQGRILIFLYFFLFLFTFLCRSIVAFLHYSLSLSRSLVRLLLPLTFDCKYKWRRVLIEFTKFFLQLIWKTELENECAKFRNDSGEWVATGKLTGSTTNKKVRCKPGPHRIVFQSKKKNKKRFAKISKLYYVDWFNVHLRWKNESSVYSCKI